jgi:hypothetical protein
MVIVDESDNGSCLIFIEGGSPMGRFRLLLGLRPYFSDVRRVNPEYTTENV